MQMFLERGAAGRAASTTPTWSRSTSSARTPRPSTYYMAMEYIDGCNLKRLAQGAATSSIARSRPSIARPHGGRRLRRPRLRAQPEGRGQSRSTSSTATSRPRTSSSPTAAWSRWWTSASPRPRTARPSTRTGQDEGQVQLHVPGAGARPRTIDRRADVWALGVTLYWLLTSSKPFRGENEAQVIHQILSLEPPALPPHVPAELQRILGKALAKNPDERYASAAALQADLERWLALAGQNVNASTVANYMSELFPESTDPDRLLTRAILSGELRQMLGQQNTPSRSLAGERKNATQAKTITAERPEPGRRNRQIAILIGLLLLILMGGVSAFVWKHDFADSPDTSQPVAEASPTPPTNNLPPAQTGITPTNTLTQPASPTQPVPQPKPQVAIVQPVVTPPIEPRTHPTRPKPLRERPSRPHPTVTVQQVSQATPQVVESSPARGGRARPTGTTRHPRAPLGVGLHRRAHGGDHPVRANRRSRGPPQGRADQRRAPRKTHHPRRGAVRRDVDRAGEARVAS